MFGRFGRTPTCDEQEQRQGHTYRASVASCDKTKNLKASILVHFGSKSCDNWISVLNGCGIFVGINTTKRGAIGKYVS